MSHSSSGESNQQDFGAVAVEHAHALALTLAFAEGKASGAIFEVDTAATEAAVAAISTTEAAAASTAKSTTAGPEERQADAKSIESSQGQKSSPIHPTSCTTSTTIPVPVLAKPSAAHSLVGLVGIIAGGNADAQSNLLSMFPSYDELFAFANSSDTNLQAEARQELPDFATRNRFSTVLDYLRKGGTWHTALDFKGVGVYLHTIVTTPATASDVSCASCSACDGTRASSTACSTSSPSTVRIEGGEGWTVVKDALDGLNVRIDWAEQTYAEGARDEIKMELEKKLGTQLHLNGKPNLRKAADHVTKSGIMEAYFKLRCRGHSKFTCKMEVEVSTTLEDNATTTVRIRRRHSDGCKEGFDHSVKKGDEKEGGMTKKQKEYCRKGFERGDTPTDIHLNLVNEKKSFLAEQGLYSNDGTLPSVYQISTYAKNVDRDSPYERNTVGLIKEICEGLSREPDDEDTPYIIRYQITSASDFNIVMSTKRLLKIFSVTIRRNIDGTYKLLRSGFPVLVMGVDDAERRYHPAILSVSATEQGKDFQFMAEAQQMHEPNVPQEIHLMADSAPAIRNGLDYAIESRFKRSMSDGAERGGKKKNKSEPTSLDGSGADPENADEATAEALSDTSSVNYIVEDAEVFSDKDLAPVDVLLHPLLQPKAFSAVGIFRLIE